MGSFYPTFQFPNRATIDENDARGMLIAIILSNVMSDRPRLFPFQVICAELACRGDLCFVAQEQEAPTGPIQ